MILTLCGPLAVPAITNGTSAPSSLPLLPLRLGGIRGKLGMQCQSLEQWTEIFTQHVLCVYLKLSMAFAIILLLAFYCSFDDVQPWPTAFGIFPQTVFVYGTLPLNQQQRYPFPQD